MSTDRVRPLGGTSTAGEGQVGRRQLISYVAAGIVTGLAILAVMRHSLLTNLFSSKYLAHRYCYLGKPSLIWTHVIADSLIGIAYLTISGALAYLVYKSRRDIPFHWMILAFGLFIVACGGTHFMEVATVWIPMYVLSGALKVFTALVSVLTAATLRKGSWLCWSRHRTRSWWPTATETLFS